jgi:ferredoxin
LTRIGYNSYVKCDGNFNRIFERRINVNFNAVRLVYFSPTKTTQKILEGIALGTAIGKIEHLDLTPPEAKTLGLDEMQDELVILGVPVYSGRVPLEAVPRLQRLKANRTPAVIIVVYGNREFEDALLELKDLARESGFIPVAGGAFIGEHSFANDTTPIANGRPDPEDLIKAKEFGMKIREKMKGIESIGGVSQLEVPGNSPYKQRRKPAEISPSTSEDPCTLCGTCASVCPVAAITVEKTVETDKLACILCCACVKNCPTGARVMEEPMLKQMAEWLSTNCQTRKEPEIFV